MMFKSKAGRLTKDVLKTISYHLSSRQDCKDVEYNVAIYFDENTKCDVIEVSPYITVFPNIYNRKESDRRGIAYHVISNHFPDILEQSTVKTVQIKPNSLVHGKYVYRKYTLTCKRRWIRV